MKLQQSFKKIVLNTNLLAPMFWFSLPSADLKNEGRFRQIKSDKSL